MAINDIKLLTSQSVSIDNGANTVSVTGSVDCSQVDKGAAVFIAGVSVPLEAISGTNFDGSGNSTVTLRNNYSGTNIVGAQMTVLDTKEGFSRALQDAREIVANISAIDSLTGSGLISKLANGSYELVDHNTFGGTGANDRIAIGEAFSATEIRFYVPIMLSAAPSSAIITSTFLARVAGSGYTGLTPVLRSDISSNKIAVFSITGLTGLTAGTFAALEAENATSKIEVVA